LGKILLKDNAEISIVANVGIWWWDILLTKEIDVLVIDLELEGLSVFWGQNTLEKIFQN
jgi:hypothetical protein